ncbi:MAG TPA: DUF6569 family protein [Planctomycetaceae bacterium]|jgi:hypothetical protein|nr:DUF6569 family protein [Planctomycetaceae bacterium]
MAVAFPQIRVGEPLRFKALSVFPLFAPSKSSVEYALADEVMRDQLLTVHEISEGGSVPELLVENKSDWRVLFIEGEELVGAKQNRVLNTSILVAAKSKTKIPVSCVERGRWRYDAPMFQMSGSHSPSSVRYALKASVTQSLKSADARYSDQGAVWDAVGVMNYACGVESPTHAMSDTFETYQKQLAEFREQLKYVDGATGLAVVIGKRVVGCDLFDKPSTCRKVWDRLLSGVSLETIARKEAGATAEAADVEQMLQTTRAANWEATPPIGEGEEYRAEFPNGDQASALTFQDSLVHGSVLAGVGSA